MNSKQRFIAGATCPKCNAMDSLVLNLDDNSVHCVDCDYVQSAEERDQTSNQNIVEKTIPKKVEIDNIIRINNLEE